jgi:SHS family lactate transporter-like MFS transporter
MCVGTLAFFFDAWDAFLLIYVLSDIAGTFHLSMGTASLALMFTYMSRWLGGVLLGNMSSRYGRRTSLVVGIAICGTFTMLTAAASSFAMLLILRLAFGIGMGGLYAAAGPLVMESVPARVRGFASGFFMFGFYVGTVLAPWTYVWLQPHFGWRSIFCFGGISLLQIPYVLLTVKESPVWLARKDELRDPAGGHRRAKPTSAWKLFAPAYILITLALLAVEFGVFFDAYPFQSILPTFLKVGRHFPTREVAFASSMIGVGALVGSVAGGLLSDRVGRKWTFAAAFVLAIVPTSVGVMAHHPPTVVVASFLNGILFGAMGGLLTAFENEHYPTDLRAVGNGLLHNLGSFAGSIGAVFVAFLHVRYGYPLSMVMIAAFGACLGLAGLSFTRETKNSSLERIDAGSAAAH